MTRIRMLCAAVVAFLMGIPFAGQAKALSLGDFVGDIIDASVDSSSGES